MSRRQKAGEIARYAICAGFIVFCVYVCVRMGEPA